MTDTERDLLRAVRENPYDNLPRLVFADWLDEHGEGDRAEFIRVQIAHPKCFALTCDCPHNPIGYRTGTTCPVEVRKTWEYIRDNLKEYGENILGTYINTKDFKGAEVTILRGFPDHITLTMSQFLGGECTACEGRGARSGTAPIRSCKSCHGTGQTPGLARELFERWPITQCRLADQMAYPSERDYRVAWFNPGVPNGRHPRIQSLPIEIFNLIEGFENRGAHPSQVKWFKTREAAHAALSDAAVAYGRVLVGLRAIHNPKVTP